MLARTVVLSIALACATAGAASAASTPLLPDLNQAYPREVQVETDASSGSPRFHLGFLSAVNNYGAGPLIVHGHRDNQFTLEMTADQVVKNADGTQTVHPGVGQMLYVNAITHQHWHYLGFDRYELRKVKGYKLVAPDQKSGFCLGDRYVNTFPDGPLPGEPPTGVYTGNCAPNDPQAVDVTEGISVAYGDDYPPIKEGQYVDVTGVPAGRYYLVHRTNADRKLLETDYSNDAASVLVALAWPHGMRSAPTVRVLNTCPETERCPIPHMSARRASAFALTALGQRVGKLASPELTCTVRSARAARCRTLFAHKRRWYSGAIGLAYSFPAGLPSWKYRAELRVSRTRCAGASSCGRPLRALSGSVKLY